MARAHGVEPEAEAFVGIEAIRRHELGGAAVDVLAAERGQLRVSRADTAMSNNCSIFASNENEAANGTYPSITWPRTEHMPRWL